MEQKNLKTNKNGWSIECESFGTLEMKKKLMRNSKCSKIHFEPKMIPLQNGLKMIDRM